MSQTSDQRVLSISADEDFVLIRVAVNGDTTSLSTLRSEDAARLLRRVAASIDDSGQELLPRGRLS